MTSSQGPRNVFQIGGGGGLSIYDQVERRSECKLAWSSGILAGQGQRSVIQIWRGHQQKRALSGKRGTYKGKPQNRKIYSF